MRMKDPRTVGNRLLADMRVRGKGGPDDAPTSPPEPSPAYSANNASQTSKPSRRNYYTSEVGKSIASKAGKSTDKVDKPAPLYASQDGSLTAKIERYNKLRILGTKRNKYEQNEYETLFHQLIIKGGGVDK